MVPRGGLSSDHSNRNKINYLIGLPSKRVYHL